MDIRKAIIPHASVDQQGRALALVLTPDRWEYVPHTELDL
ncbi:hypothetical protein KIW74_gp07 [Mycobacterium phage Kimona]|uniref:Uncharacterized protein n=1 Tax=Mycobacterium phage Kimona TaxID=2024295 RepID=A0A249XU66_9CAUD|nr:hypothetical protein KIW74_gp07 [Mycobacterium phage Kimona]ASZ75521.1 hypothetical protein PBI_KIMONA_85 [Mycobacterium phage Kimona]